MQAQVASLAAIPLVWKHIDWHRTWWLDWPGLLAAPFGFIDWLAIPSATRAKYIGAVHGLGNVVVVVMFALSWLLRSDAPRAPEGMALALSFAAGALALFTGWLGGELVDRLAVGVDEGAHLDAPSSLSSRRVRA